MSFNTPITMPRTPKKTAKGKRPYRPESEAGADDNESIQSTEMDPKTPVPSQHPRKEGESSGQVNQHHLQQSDKRDAMMANLLERVERMESENRQKEQELETYRRQHSRQHRPSSSSSQEGVAERIARLLGSQMSEDDKEEDRLTKKARDYWLEIPKLQGRENYRTWRIQIENDANILKALPVILTRPDQIDRRWEICNQLLVKRMVSSMTSEVALEVQTGHFQSAYEIASYLDSMKRHQRMGNINMP